MGAVCDHTTHKTKERVSWRVFQESTPMILLLTFSVGLKCVVEALLTVLLVVSWQCLSHPVNGWTRHQCCRWAPRGHLQQLTVHFCPGTPPYHCPCLLRVTAHKKKLCFNRKIEISPGCVFSILPLLDFWQNLVPSSPFWVSRESCFFFFEKRLYLCSWRINISLMSKCSEDAQKLGNKVVMRKKKGVGGMEWILFEYKIGIRQH